MKTRKILWKVFFVCLLGLSLLTGRLLYMQWQKQQAIQHEISELTRQSTSLSEKNDLMKQTLAYLHTNNYKESIARKDLNLKENGEIVINFTENPTASSTQTDASTMYSKKGPMYNLLEWWNYFFPNS